MSGSVSARLAAEYVLPLRWADDRELDDLTQYLGWLAGQLDVTVVDGSPPPIYERHAAAWGGRVRHLAPTAPDRGNGKVAGVISGLCAARHEAVIIADDDVRWDRAALERAIELLDRGDLVRPQNVFRPTPWHAKWDTGRSLVNRAVGGDYPGTYAVRRSTFVRMGGYAGDVLFENLELARTVIAHGGTEVVASSLFVDRRPPTTRHFLGQRVRQAYDDFAQPGKLVVEASVLPGLALAHHLSRRTGTRRYVTVIIGALITGSVAVAELGRRIDGGRAVYRPTAALWAPAWLAERTVTIWIAIGYRLRGGIPYAGSRIRLAAHSAATLAALGDQQRPASADERRLGSRRPARWDPGQRGLAVRPEPTRGRAVRR